MISALWWLGGTGMLAIVAVVLVGVLGAWPLVLNRYVLGGLAVLLTCLGVAAAYEVWAQRLRDEGAAALVAANEAANVERQKATKEFEQDKSDLVKEQQERLATANAQTLAARTARERDTHVSKNAAGMCRLTVGFLWDYDASLPSIGRGKIPESHSADDTPAAISIADASKLIGRNNDICASAIEQLAAIDARRYGECLAWDKRFGTHSGCAK